MQQIRIPTRSSRRLAGAATIAAVYGLIATPSPAAQVQWTGATDNVWATGTNWVGGTPPADDLTTDVALFNSAFNTSPNAGTRSVAGLNVGVSRTTSFTISADTAAPGLSIGGSGIDLSAVTSASVVLTLGGAATQQFTIAAPQTWTTGNANTAVTVAGAMAINNRITVNGAGTARFQVANTGAGGVTLNSGTLVINNPNGIGTGSLIINGGSLNNAMSVTLPNNVQQWNGDFGYLGTGSLNLGTGAITMPNSIQITVNGTTSNVLTAGGAIAATTAALAKAGTGQLALTGNNKFSGGLTVRNGLLEGQYGTAGNTPFGTAGITLGDATGSNPATLRLQGSFATVTNPLTLGGTTGLLTLSTRNSGTALSVTGGINGPNSLRLDNGASNNTQPLNITTNPITITGTLSNVTSGTGVGGVSISAVIGATVAGVVQNSPAQMTLSGANLYGGTTSIDQGTLYANTAGPTNSATGASTVTVGPLGTLGGNGRVGGAVTIGGTLSPGIVATPVGTLTIGAANTALTFADSASMNVQAGSATADLVNLTGANSTVAFGPTWNLNVTAGTGDPTGTTITLIDYTSTIDPALPTTVNFTGTHTGTLSIDTTNHAVVLSNITAVPEPASLAAIAIGAGGLLHRRRRCAERQSV